MIIKNSISNPLKMVVSGVILDLDGTLLHTGPIIFFYQCKSMLGLLVIVTLRVVSISFFILRLESLFMKNVIFHLKSPIDPKV